MAHQRILEYLCTNHWAILPEVLQSILCIAQGENESPEAVAERLGRPLQNTRTVTHRDGVAVLPVGGPIFRYANILTEISGATSVEVLATDFRAALDDPDIRGIVLEVDSPGGQIAGISEFADQVAAAGKPTVAYISDLGASAGYWIASAADQVIIRDTAAAGSVGVVATLRRDKKDDRIQIVSSQSPRKRVDPDTEDGRAVLQAVVDDIADVFIGRVASYRDVSAEHVLEHFGQGGSWSGATPSARDWPIALGPWNPSSPASPANHLEARPCERLMRRRPHNPLSSTARPWQPSILRCSKPFRKRA